MVTPAGGLLAELTPRESDRLWWRVVRAIAAVSDEIECLILAPEAIRDRLYGPGVLESYRGLRAELADLAQNEIRRTVAGWNDLLADDPEEGETPWQGSEARHPAPSMTFTRLAARVTLRRAWSRLTPRR